MRGQPGAWRLPLAMLALASLGCAGARFHASADQASYPVSFSPALADSERNVLYLGRELRAAEDFEFKRTSVGVFYGATGSNIDLSEDLNQRVRDAGGAGIVNLSIENKNCWSNYLFPLPILPFYPGCQVVKVTGTVVQVEEPK